MQPNRFRSLAALALCTRAFAQAPAFETASVKPSTPASSPGPEFNFANGGGLAIRSGALKGILEMAFDVRDFQISGAPAWTNAESFDIFAKSAADAGGNASVDELRQQARRKLQTLLGDRFQLQFHRETRQLRVYHLTVAKSGPKFAESKLESPNGGIRGRCGLMIATNSGIGSLTYSLSRELGSRVEDQTGLSGRYYFQLEYTSGNTACTPPPDIVAALAPADRPSLFTALQEQLGLKLEAAKGPVEVIVIDRIERPSAN